MKPSITILRRLCALALLAAALRVPLHAAGAAANPPAPLAGSALERALDTVSASEISSDIFFIAADEMGGRDTPSVGQRIAARFIRARLQRLGFQPGAESGFFFTYPLTMHQLDVHASSAGFARGERKEAWEFGRDYFFYARGDSDLEVSGAVVACGSGSKDDFASADAKGKWALVQEGESSWREREKLARADGALGLVVFAGPDYKGEPYEARFADHVERARRGSVSWPSKPKEGAAVEQPFPQIYLPSTSATRLLAGSAGAMPALGADLGVVFSERRKYVGDAGSVNVENVCGFWPGSDPVLGNEVLIVSAHYDHVGIGKNGDVYNGADDNGSGTCGMLALAEALATHGPMRRSVMLMWVSGEEKGLWGSKAWTEHPWLPGGRKPVCDINIDMIGRNAPDKLLITPTSKRKEYNGLVRLAEKNAPLEGFPSLGSCDDYWNRSDHANFASNLKIPVTFLFSDVHEDYHETTDDPEKIDNDKIRRVVRLVLRMLDGLQDEKLAL